MGTDRQGNSINVTKIDAAEANIVAAVHLHFNGGHPVPVMVLANSAREIVATIGEKIGIETVHAAVATNLGKTVPETIAHISKAAGFLKHANRQMTGMIKLNDRDVEVALYLACLDFGIVAGGLPIEAQVYEGWIIAKGVEKVSAMPLKYQQMIRSLIRHFPGIRRADPATQKKLGLNALRAAERDPALKMTIQHDVSQIIACREQRTTM